MKKLVLVEDSGARTGREHAVSSVETVLGRDEACTVRFADVAGVSRRHAAVESRDGGFFLVDRGSANGTFLNGARLAAPGALKDGDVIALGEDGPRLAARLTDDARPQAAARESAGATILKTALYDPARDKKKGGGVLGVVVIVGMMMVSLGMGLLVFLFTTASLGLATSLAGVVMAFAPLPLYLAMWLWLDRYDPEPAWALAGCFLWGAGAATFVSLIFNTTFGAVVTSATGNAGMSEVLSASISAPFVEEATKGLAVLIIFLVLRREFDGVLDGIVYAGVVALGFAAVENVVYYGRSFNKGGLGAMIFVFILRGVLGPFSHAVFTSMTGIGCGIARQSHNLFIRFVAPIGGYAAAVFLHSLWNTLAWLSGNPLGFLVLYVLFWVPLFLIVMGLFLWIAHRESKLIKRMLESEVKRGLLTQQQAEVVSIWRKRVGWQLGSLSNLTRLRARRGFLRAATRLALSYWHAERATEAGGETVSAGLIPVFRSEVAKLAPLV